MLGPGTDAHSVTQAIAWSVPFYGAMMLAQYFMLRAVGADPGVFSVVLGAPLVSLCRMTPVTINGLFLAEGAFVLVYASAGVPPEVALAAAIVRRLVDLANSGLGGGMWLAWHFGIRGGSDRDLRPRAARAVGSRAGARLTCGALPLRRRMVPGRGRKDMRASDLRRRSAGRCVPAPSRLPARSVRDAGAVCVLDLRGSARAGPGAAQPDPVVRRPDRSI